MSAFASNFQSAFDGSMPALQGEDFTFSPKTGGTSTKRGTVDPVKDSVSGQIIKSLLRLRVSKTEITLPVAGDKATIRGRACVFSEVLPGTGNIWDCSIKVGAEVA